MVKSLFNIPYICGCIHEIKQEGNVFTPTGNNKPCVYHKKVV